ncbi:Acyltransferase family protein [compost metagenome]
MKKQRLFYLDLIRAVSLICIVIYHFNLHVGFHGINGPMVFKFINNDYFAGIGISLFVLISGASLMYTYQQKFELKNYIKRRFLSIYPVFWTGYIIAFLFNFYMNLSINDTVPKWAIIFSVLGMDGYLSQLVPNFYQVGEWFLGFIIIFYVIFPFLRKYVVERPVILATSAFLLYGASIWLNIYGYNFFRYPDIFSYLPEFLFGMYFVVYLKKVNVFLFSGSLIFLYLSINGIIDVYSSINVLILCVSSFLTLTFIGQMIGNIKVQACISFISKYSFAGIIANQMVMIYIMRRFTGVTLTRTESYLLFLIVFAVIMLTAVTISKLSNKAVKILVSEKES